MRLKYNFQQGATGTALSTSSSGTSQAITGLFAVAPSFATITGSDYIPLVIDPFGTQEIVWITAYTAGSLNATITRGSESTSAPAHSTVPTAWLHGATLNDYTQQMAVVGPPTTGTHIVNERQIDSNN